MWYLRSDSKSNGVEAFYANYGCQGGFTESAYGYIMKAGGLAKEVDYPYTSYYSAAGVCNAIKSNYAVTVKNFYVLKGESSMESHVLSTGPLSVCLDASLWSSYSSGVISSCGKTIDHCVQVVGINLKEGYWIVRNSWGTKWGNKGFIYLSTVSPHLTSCT
jgi:C1A family cysteine protease